MSIAHATDRYTELPDDETLAATVVALEEHGSASRSSPNSTPPAKLSALASPRALS
jgi:hypothetical protein